MLSVPKEGRCAQRVDGDRSARGTTRCASPRSLGTHPVSTVLRHAASAAVVALCVLSGGLAHANSNYLVWEDGVTDPITIADLTANYDGFMVGDKLFTDFSVTPNIQTPAENEVAGVSPNATGISIQGTIVNGTDFGLVFTGGWVATPNELVDTRILFKVTATDPGQRITDSALQITSFGTTQFGSSLPDGAVVGITENVFIENPDSNVPAGNLANMSVTFIDDTLKKITDIRDFTVPTDGFDTLPSDALLLPDDGIGLSSIWVAKDVVLRGGQGPGGVAQLSGFLQAYGQLEVSTIPEPATAGLIGIGSLLLATRRRR